MIPGVLAWALGSMELAFTKRGKAERGAGFFLLFSFLLFCLVWVSFFFSFFFFLEGVGLGVLF